jgi:hypothetical protein
MHGSSSISCQLQLKPKSYLGRKHQPPLLMFASRFASCVFQRRHQSKRELNCCIAKSIIPSDLIASQHEHGDSDAGCVFTEAELNCALADQLRLLSRKCIDCCQEYSLTVPSPSHAQTHATGLHSLRLLGQSTRRGRKRRGFEPCTNLPCRAKDGGANTIPAKRLGFKCYIYLHTSVA